MDNKVLFQLSYGLYGIGVMDGEKPTGCIVNTVFQITSDNPSIAVSLNKDNYTTDVVKKTKKFTVSILAEQVDSAVIGDLGFKSGKDWAKFQDIPYDLMGGLPVVKEGATGYLLCEVLSVTENGTHDVIIAKIADAKFGSEGTPMTYKYYHEVKKGTAPKNAPTYRGADIENPTDEGEETYVCSVCGHVHKGPFPDGYKCPVCGQGKEVFKKQGETAKTESYVCAICGHVHEGPLPADFVCPVCGMGAEAFKKI
ncbi:MAG: flavin reductase [Clostridiales bacterium]